MPTDEVPVPGADDEGSAPAASCPVCGAALGPAPVVCPDCHTPHHWDCWEYNGGCATYACPRKVRFVKKRPAAESPGGDHDQPGKIPFPRLAAGSFLGVFFVTWLTALTAIVAEILAIISFAAGSWDGGSLFLSLMVGALFWAGLTAEVYNLDVKEGWITRSKLLLGRELFEWRILPLRLVHALDLHEGVAPGGVVVRRLFALLVSGRAMELTPEYPRGGQDDRAVLDLLRKVEAGTRLRLGRMASEELHRLSTDAPPQALPPGTLQD